MSSGSDADEGESNPEVVQEKVFLTQQQAEKGLSNITETKQSEVIIFHNIKGVATEMNAHQGRAGEIDGLRQDRWHV